MTYLWLKLIHLSAAMLWTSSAIGAFWYVVVARQQQRQRPDQPELQRRDEWVRLHFLYVVVLEHLAFIVLLITGPAMMWELSWSWTVPWLWWKLAIVLGAFVPLELIDVWLSHWAVPRALRGSDPSWRRRVLRWHDLFLGFGMLVVAVGIPLVLWLVVLKPSL